VSESLGEWNKGHVENNEAGQFSCCQNRLALNQEARADPRFFGKQIFSRVFSIRELKLYSIKKKKKKQRKTSVDACVQNRIIV